MEIRAKDFRVYLKSLSEGDADALAENANDYEIVYNIAELGRFPYPYRKTDALNFIARSAEEARMKVGLHLAVHLVENDAFMGMCGIKDINPETKSCELGYWIGRKYWGHGYGREAARLMVAYAFGRLGIKKILAVSFIFNDRSQKLLTLLGFHNETEVMERAARSLSVADSIYSLELLEYNDDLQLEVKTD